MEEDRRAQDSERTASEHDEDKDPVLMLEEMFEEGREWDRIGKRRSGDDEDRKRRGWCRWGNEEVGMNRFECWSTDEMSKCGRRR